MRVRRLVIALSSVVLVSGVAATSSAPASAMAAMAAASRAPLPTVPAAWHPVASASTRAVRGPQRARPASSLSGSPVVEPLSVPLGLGQNDGVDGMAVADLNGDGIPDLALVEHKDNINQTGVTYLATLFGNGDLSFRTPTLIQLSDGGSPISLTGAAQVPMVVADLRGTGRHDIVVGVPGRSELLVYLDEGAGTYPGIPRVVSLPGAAVRIAAADLGNGHQDLVALLATSPPEVITLMGDGTGAFPTSAVSTFKSGLTPNDLAVVALTSTGAPDIVVSGYDGGNGGDDTNVGILLNQGAGSYPATATMINSGLDALGFEVGNFSGSGHVDLLAAGDHCNAGTGPVYCQILLPGNGDGTFGAPTTADTVALAANPERGATPNVAMDLDGDGHDDAVWVHGGESASPTMVTVAYGDGHGGFTTTEWVGTGTANTEAMAVTVADLTGSGPLDLVIEGNASSGTFTDVTGGLYVIPPDPAHARAFDSGRILEPGVAFPGNTAQTATGDFSGSGHLDIATMSASPPEINLLPGNGDGTFGTEKSVPIAAGTVGFGPVSADFDGDGHPDLAWTSPSNGIYYSLGNGAGGFATAVHVAGGGTVSSITVTDLNGDGHPDLLTVYTNNNGAFLQGFLWDASTGTFDAGPISGPFPAVSQGAYGRAVGVFTSSGHVDVALVTTVAGQSLPQVVVFPGDGTGAFDVAHPIDVASECSTINLGPVVAGDLSGDGHDDLVWQCASTVYVALGNGDGDGTFTSPTSYADPWIFSSSSTASQLVLAHVRSAQRLDLVEVGTAAAGADGPGGPILFPGNGDGTLAAPIPLAAGNSPESTVTAAPLGGGALDDLVLARVAGAGVAGGLVTVLMSTGGAGLTASAITAPASSVVPGQPVGTSFTVANLGSAPASGTWTDSVFVGSTPAFTVGDALLGTVTHAGDVAPGQSYRSTLPPTALPGVTAGSRYLIVVPDSGGLFDTVPSGAGASPAFTVDPVPVLTIGGPATTGTIAAGEVSYFQVAPAVGKALVLQASFGTRGTARFAERSGAFPDPVSGTADETYPTPADLVETLDVPHPQGGTTYVMLSGLSGAGAGHTFSILATQPTLAVAAFSPTSFTDYQPADSTGCSLPGSPVCDRSTLTVTGSGFTAATRITLVSRPPGREIGASSVRLVASTTVVAEFPAGAGLPDGAYTVEASDGPASATAAAALTVSTSKPDCALAGAAPRLRAAGDIGLCGIVLPPVTVSLAMDSLFRPPSPARVTISWTNLSGSDQPAPVIELVGYDADFLDSTTGIPTGSSEAEVLGVGSGGDAGVLARGESGSITLSFVQPVIGLSSIVGYLIEPGATVDWVAALAPVRPATVTPAAWAVISANFASDAGSTLGGYEAMLDGAASYLSQIGEQPTGDANQELRLELAAADDFGAVSSRFADGALGLGRADPTDDGLTVRAGGTVVLHQAGQEEDFVPLADGVYASPAGEQSTLSKESDGSWRLRSPDGSVSAWSPAGQFEFSTDPNGNKTAAAYDGSGRLVTLTAPGTQTTTFAYGTGGLSDRVVSITPPSGRALTVDYDASGRESRVASGGTALTYSYEPSTAPSADQNGVASITDSTGVVTTFAYDARGRVSTVTAGKQRLTYRYGPFGELTVTDATGTANTYFLDASGIPVVTVDPLGRRTAVSLDQLGRPVAVAAPGGLTVSYAYNAAGDITSETDPAGRIWSYGYDAAGQLISATDPKGATTTVVRDAHGNATEVLYPGGTSARATYSASGEVTATIDQSGRVTTYGYDPQLRLTRVSFPDGTALTYTYDAAGDLATATDQSGTDSYTYNAFGALASVSEPGGRSLAYTYDPAGRLASATDETGFSLHDVYAGGELAKVTDGSGTTLVTESYDAAGRLVGESRANGTSVDFSHDAAGELTGVTNKGPSGAVTGAYTLTYGPTGMPATLTTPAGTETLGFDAAGELTSVALPGGRTISYAYDADGNRSSVTDGDVTTSYTANALDEYTSVGATTYTYDPEGDVTASSGPAGNSSWSYDERGRLVAATTPSGSSSYAYDPNSSLLSATRSNTTTGYLPNPLGGGIPFATFDGSGTLTAHEITRGTSLVGVEPPSGGASFLGVDTNQDVVQVTDPTGAVVSTASYLPFGQVLSSSGAGGPAGFAGGAGLLAETGGEQLVHFRPYDPSTGRFLTRDPIGAPGADPYTYALNDPVQLLDRNGLDPTLEQSTTDTAVGLLTGGLDYFGGQVQQAANSLINSANIVINNPYNAGRVIYDLENYPGFFERFGVLGQDLGVNYGNLGLSYYKDAVVTSSNLGLVSNALVGVSAVVDVATPFFNPNSTAGDFSRGGGLAAADVGSLWCPPAGLAAHFVDWTSKTVFPVIAEWWDSGEVDGGQWFLHKFGIWDTFGNGSTRNINDHDPNDIHGPAGYGTAHWLAGTSPMPFTIEFANQANATAPVQTMSVSETLDAHVDLSTFRFGPVGFVDTTVSPPPAAGSWSITVPDTPAVSVRIAGSLDTADRKVVWKLTAVDPATGLPVSDPLAGFLAPDVTPPEGEGFVSYTVSPAIGLPTPTTVRTSASVVFDQNPAIPTATLTNAIDSSAPATAVVALPARTAAGDLTVSWKGSDGSGSGIASYRLYVSVDGGRFSAVGGPTAGTSLVYRTSVGHRYGFAVVATDHAGNGGGAPSVASVTTTAVPAQGYYVAGRNGTVLASGAVPALPGFSTPAADPVVGLATTPDGRGWFAVTADGAVHVAGDATYAGDLLHPPGGAPPVQVSDIVAIAPTTDGRGYWLIGNDGGMFAFGDARYHGSLPGLGLRVHDVVGMVATPSGAGYLVVGSDGGVFAFGATHFFGSLPGDHVHITDVRSILPAPGGTGYLLVGADGGAFVFGHGAPYEGSLPERGVHVTDIVGIALTSDGVGYWMAGAGGSIDAFGDATRFPSPANLASALPIAAIAGS